MCGLLAESKARENNKPAFESLTESGPDLIVWTGPTGDAKAVQLWEWLDLGVKPHTITARNAPFLQFRSGYQAKTEVGKYKSGKSKRYGTWRRTIAVHHPGIEARGWSARYTKERQKPFETRMETAMRKAANNAF